MQPHCELMYSIKIKELLLLPKKPGGCSENPAFSSPGFAHGSWKIQRELRDGDELLGLQSTESLPKTFRTTGSPRLNLA